MSPILTSPDENKEEYEIFSAQGELYSYDLQFGLQISWESNIGFGQLTFIYDPESETWDCDTECMSEEFCKAVLNKWLHSILEEK